MAVNQYGIEYPVVLDNNYGTWSAYGNRYWPRKYLIDIDGYIAYDHIGEGAYEKTERKIQELLEERREVLGTQEKIDREVTQPIQVKDVDFGSVQSPEVYFGASRNEYLGNGARGKVGVQEFSTPETLQPNTLYLTGTWHIGREHAASRSAGARIIFRYHAKNVNFVARTDAPTDIKILRDGKPVAGAAGADVGAEGTATIHEARLYELVDDPEGYGGHVIEIIVPEGSVQAFTFTFG